MLQDGTGRAQDLEPIKNGFSEVEILNNNLAKSTEIKNYNEIEKQNLKKKLSYNMEGIIYGTYMEAI